MPNLKQMKIQKMSMAATNPTPFPSIAAAVASKINK